MKPDICTSLNCSNYGCDYCSKCSHSIIFGSGTDSTGKEWRWTFNSWFDTVYYCPECEEELTFIFHKDPISISYRHPLDCICMINGYPSPCINNGKELMKDQVKEKSTPVYHKDVITMM